MTRPHLALSPTTLAAPVPQGVGDGFRDAMGRLAAAVSVVTTGAGDARRGFTCTSVASVSTDPPMVSVCVNRGVDAHNQIIDGGAFCVNILSLGQDAISNRFAARDGSKGAVRFADDPWEQTAGGVPALATAMANLDCAIVATANVGTHTLVIGRVNALNLRADRAPLMYFDRAYRKIA